MDKSFFTARFPSGGAKAAKGDINGILHLRQRVGELWIVRVIDAGDIQQRATRRGGDIIDMPIPISSRSRCPPTSPVAPVIST